MKKKILRDRSFQSVNISIRPTDKIYTSLPIWIILFLNDRASKILPWRPIFKKFLNDQGYSGLIPETKKFKGCLRIFPYLIFLMNSRSSKMFCNKFSLKTGILYESYKHIHLNFVNKFKIMDYYRSTFFSHFMSQKTFVFIFIFFSPSLYF